MGKKFAEFCGALMLLFSSQTAGILGEIEMDEKKRKKVAWGGRKKDESIEVLNYI